MQTYSFWNDGPECSESEPKRENPKHRVYDPLIGKHSIPVINGDNLLERILEEGNFLQATDFISLSNTGCKKYDGTCEECPCCIQNEIAGYIFGVEKMKQILDGIEDNTLHEYDPNI